MALLSFAELEAVIKPVIDREIQRQFAENQSVYEKWMKKSVPTHPWLDDVRTMARMMAGQVKIPHGNCKVCARARELKNSFERIQPKKDI